MAGELQVILSGGPPRLADDERVHRVDNLEQRVKLLRGNGREHFTYSGETAVHDGLELPRFDWVAHTDVAE